MVIFLVGVLGLLPLLISNIKYNEAVQKAQVAQKILEDMASELRGIRVYYFKKGNLIYGNQSNPNLVFEESPPHGYPPVPQGCPAGYDYALYRGYELYKIVRGSPVKYKYTLKLCVDDDYLKPYLKRAKLWIYWMYEGREHNLSTQFFITAK